MTIAHGLTEVSPSSFRTPPVIMTLGCSGHILQSGGWRGPSKTQRCMVQPQHLLMPARANLSISIGIQRLGMPVTKMPGQRTPALKAYFRKLIIDTIGCGYLCCVLQILAAGAVGCLAANEVYVNSTSRWLRSPPSGRTSRKDGSYTYIETPVCVRSSSELCTKERDVPLHLIWERQYECLYSDPPSVVVWMYDLLLERFMYFARKEEERTVSWMLELWLLLLGMKSYLEPGWTRYSLDVRMISPRVIDRTIQLTLGQSYIGNILADWVDQERLARTSAAV